MSTARILSGKCVCLTLVIAVVTTMAVDPLKTWGGEPSKEPSNRTRDLDKLIDALANRNPQPKVVKSNPADWEALFDEDFDWKEQGRVVDAIQRVLKQASPEMWQRLVAHTDDSRYCLTFNDQAEAADTFATNWTVGQVCHEIARFQFICPVDRATQPIRVGERPIHLPLSPIRGMPKAGELRSAKTFVELQIQACQQAIEDLPKIKDKAKTSGREAKTDPETLKQCRARLEAEIEKLKKSKNGIFGEFRFPSDRFELLDSKNAAEIRERYEKAKKREDIKDDPEAEKNRKNKK